eukprot:6900954-Prymnesium_polylepis.1
MALADGILNVGIIGAGRIGVVHLEALASCPTVPRAHATCACVGWRYAHAALAVPAGEAGDHLQPDRLQGRGGRRAVWRAGVLRRCNGGDQPPGRGGGVDLLAVAVSRRPDPVSYTHLTLPTICSV